MASVTIYLSVLIFIFHQQLINAVEDKCGAVTRQEWGATTNNPLTNMNIPVDLVVIQHTVTQECHTSEECSRTVRDVQKSHITINNFDDIAQSFLVGGDGKVYEGRGWTHVGAHTFKYNDKSIGISFIGDFREKLPNESALTAAKDLISCGVQNGYLTQDYKLVGHRQLSATESPGAKLYEQIQSWPHWHNQ